MKTVKEIQWQYIWYRNLSFYLFKNGSKMLKTENSKIDNFKKLKKASYWLTLSGNQSARFYDYSKQIFDSYGVCQNFCGCVFNYSDFICNFGSWDPMANTGPNIDKKKAGRFWLIHIVYFYQLWIFSMVWNYSNTFF